MTPISDSDADRIGQKPRPKGKLPHLPDGPTIDELRGWLTLAFRPPSGFEVAGFERLGRELEHPAVLIVANGRESRRFRFKRQRDLSRTPRMVALAVADGWLAMPHLSAGEVEDVWAALCTLGRVLTEQDEPTQTREWIEALLPATTPLEGHTLVPDGRHDALMAIRAAGEFGKTEALSLVRGGEVDGWRQLPTRFIDAQTGEHWLRVGETATYIRYVIGVEPLPHSTLRARLHEIGIEGHGFEDYRPPHPKLQLYRLTGELVEGLQ